MTPESGTGTRIREKRLSLGVKQAALAREAGISAAYLNLIEHNRRGIAGKLLGDIARALQTEPASLTAGADASLVAALSTAADAMPDTEVESGGSEDLARRFPGWSALIVAQARAINDLRRKVEELSDKMTHDPHLAASLHELLSTVTSINASASILAEPGELEPEWQQRFHRNIHEDSQRAAEASHALVAFLEADEEAGQNAVTPQDALENWLETRGYHLDAFERHLPADPKTFAAEADALETEAARALAERWCARYRADAALLPLAPFQAAARGAGFDPLPLAAQFGVSLATVLRRLAMLPQDEETPRFGLLLCDGSGTLTFRKAIPGFPVPRFGAACPLWPLYKALNRPLSPIRSVLEIADRDNRKFVTYAVAEPLGVPRYDTLPNYEAAMLIVPVEAVAEAGDVAPSRVGASCRVCAHDTCSARREPSILDIAP